MFTGIVEEAGRLVAREERGGGARFVIDASRVAEGVALGDSIAHNGCCLTVAAADDERLSYDLLEETLRATNLGEMRVGSLINLERSLRTDSRLGGHFVTGHVDTTCKVLRWERDGGDYVLEVEVPEGYERYLVPKGCIALDGISLTVGRVKGRCFNVWIIPHTLEVTALKDRKVGDRLNLEVDMLAKYVEKLVDARVA